MKARALLFIPALTIELIMLVLGIVCIGIKFRFGFYFLERIAANYLPDPPWYFQGWIKTLHVNKTQ